MVGIKGIINNDKDRIIMFLVEGSCIFCDVLFLMLFFILDVKLGLIFEFRYFIFEW